MTTKPGPKVRVSVQTASCVLFSTWPMVCPLCGVLVPASTNHACTKKEPK